MSPPPALSDLRDQGVVALALAGRQDAYNELLRRYQGPVFTVIYRIVRDRDAAEELTQETFVRVSDTLHRYRPEHKFSSWIFKIANNLSVDHLRHQQVETEALEALPHAATPPEVWPGTVEADTDPAPAPAVSPEQRQALEEAIGRLNRKYRDCMKLRHLHGRSYDSIGEILHLPLGTVKTRLHRGLKQLEAALSPLRDRPAD